MTTTSTELWGRRSHDGLSIARCALAGATTVALLVALCWVGALFASSQTHIFLALFTDQPVASVGAPAESVCWAVVSGAGAIWALAYNTFGFMDGRPRSAGSASAR